MWAMSNYYGKIQKTSPHFWVPLSRLEAYRKQRASAKVKASPTDVTWENFTNGFHGKIMRV